MYKYRKRFSTSTNGPLAPTSRVERVPHARSFRLGLGGLSVIAPRPPDHRHSTSRQQSFGSLGIFRRRTSATLHWSSNYRTPPSDPKTHEGLAGNAPGSLSIRNCSARVPVTNFRGRRGRHRRCRYHDYAVGSIALPLTH